MAGIMAEMAVFRRKVQMACNFNAFLNLLRILKERHIQMRKPVAWLD